MTTETDKWDMDPSVQRQRKIFASLDRTQNDILSRTKISPFDERLRYIRETAKNVFEKTSFLAVRKGLDLSDEAFAEIYAGCLMYALGVAGITAAKEISIQDKTLLDLLREAIR